MNFSENSSSAALSALDGVESWLFDLDNTLYDASTNVFNRIDERMSSFIADFLDLAPAEAYRLQKQYFREFGTTLRGLIDRHGVEPELFLKYVHDIDLGPLEPSPALDAALARLPGRKIIFTNASVEHALRIIDRLGISRHFEAIFDVACADYVPKPDPRVYNELVRRFGLKPSATVFIDDIARNLKPAAALGMTTVWARCDSEWSHEGANDDYIHHTTDDLIAWLEEAGGSIA